MIYCTACGGENPDGTKFCSKCGAQLAPAAESWRTPVGDAASGNVGGSSQSDFSEPEVGYAPPPSSSSSPSSSYPTYSPPLPASYDQSSYGQPQGESMHPGIPALVSFFLPGLGLLFVPNKVGLGLGVFAAYIVLNIVVFFLTVVTLGIGSCLFLLVPLANVAAAIHSYDEAAKASGGRFQPVLFKN